MDIFNLISLGGGLALFLYGMNIMGSGLERAAGGKLEKTLEKFTGTILKGVLFGAAVTAAIQSSSATTVIAVGFVNAGIMKLRQAIGLIMGANIGTTITAHILSLSEIGNAGFILQFIKPTTLSPILALIGIIMFMTAKKKGHKEIGQVLLGFSILFTGLFAMESAVAPLAEMEWFRNIFAVLSNPFLGILAGAVVTAVIQSSSASVGILQALTSTGAVTLSSAFPIILGQNIGTCATSMISSVGANKNAKRTAIVHLYFNVIGSIIFMIVVYSGAFILKNSGVFDFWGPHIIDKSGIALIHTVFNVFVTLIFLPFTKLLEKLACLTIKGSDETEADQDLVRLDERFLSTPSVALEQSEDIICRMGNYAAENFLRAVSLVDKYDPKVVSRILETESSIDRMEDKLSTYLVRLADAELADRENLKLNELLHCIGEFERIGDYSVNIYERAEQLYNQSTHVSEEAIEDLGVVTAAVYEIITGALDAFRMSDRRKAACIEPLEETIDEMEALLKDLHVQRLREGKCSVDGGVIFLDLLTNLERIADHCSNIGVYVLSLDGQPFDRHMHKMHEGELEEYNRLFASYEEKYLDVLKHHAV